MLGLVGGAPAGNTSRVAGSSAAGACRGFHVRIRIPSKLVCLSTLSIIEIAVPARLALCLVQAHHSRVISLQVAAISTSPVHGCEATNSSKLAAESEHRTCQTLASVQALSAPITHTMAPLAGRRRPHQAAALLLLSAQALRAPTAVTPRRRHISMNAGGVVKAAPQVITIDPIGT